MGEGNVKDDEEGVGGKGCLVRGKEGAAADGVGEGEDEKVHDYINIISMAKKSTILYRLLSSAGTGFFYIGKKNTR